MTAPVTGDAATDGLQPIKGRCGTCDWPTDRLPCPYCEAVARDRIRRVLGEADAIEAQPTDEERA